MAKDTKTKVRASDTKEQGTVYITSLGNTPYFQNPTIDADKLFHLTKNVYAAGVAHKQRNLIFQEKYTITATNEDGEQDETSEQLVTSLTKMTDAPDVDLWSRMQKSYYDFFFWGPSLFNPVWQWVDNEYQMVKLRRLPPHSFRTSAPTSTYRYSDILPGISYNLETNTVEYWQTDDTGGLTQLDGITMIKDPVSEGLAGEPIITPLVPIFEMLNFSWQSQMQKVNREGAPIVLMRLTTPTEDDLAYGQTFLKNWGKNTAWPLRENMEVIPLQFSENSTAIETINALNAVVVDYFSPASSISKDGTLIGGSSGPEYELFLAYLRGQQAWISQAFTRMLDPYLEANGYEGYTISIDIPSPSVDKSEIWLKQAEFGLKAGIMSPNELREYGAELGPMDPEAWEELKTERAVLDIQQATPGTMTPTQENIEKAKVITANRLDPYTIVEKKDFRSTMRNLLNLKVEEGGQ